MRRGLLLSVIVLLGVGVVLWLQSRMSRWMSPRDSRIFLHSALVQFALDHDGKFPAGKATPEASLSVMYPKYIDAFHLAASVVPLNLTQHKLDRGELLGPESCGWHYVEGLTLNDDPRLAIAWIRNREEDGLRSVIFVNGNRDRIPAAEWQGFLADQKRLLASRAELARKGSPVLHAKVRLPDGKIAETLGGPFELQHERKFENSTGTGSRSGPELSTVSLRWYRNVQCLEQGTTTFVLFWNDWRSRPVTVEVTKGRVFPNAIVFEMAR